MQDSPYAVPTPGDAGARTGDSKQPDGWGRSEPAADLRSGETYPYARAGDLHSDATLRVVIPQNETHRDARTDGGVQPRAAMGAPGEGDR